MTSKEFDTEQSARHKPQYAKRACCDNPEHMPQFGRPLTLMLGPTPDDDQHSNNCEQHELQDERWQYELKPACVGLHPGLGLFKLSIGNALRSTAARAISRNLAGGCRSSGEYSQPVTTPLSSLKSQSSGSLPSAANSLPVLSGIQTTRPR